MGVAGPFSFPLTEWDSVFLFSSWCFSGSTIHVSDVLSAEIPVVRDGASTKVDKG